jgi:hypothetical protein
LHYIYDDSINICCPESGSILLCLNEKYLLRQNNILISYVILDNVSNNCKIIGRNLSEQQIIFTFEHRIDIDILISLSLDCSILSILDRDEEEFIIYKIVNGEIIYFRQIQVDYSLITNVEFTDSEMITVAINDLFNNDIDITVYDINNFDIINSYTIVAPNSRIFSQDNKHFIQFDILEYKIYETVTGEIISRCNVNVQFIKDINILYKFPWFCAKMIILFSLNFENQYHMHNILTNRISIVNILPCDSITLHGTDYISKSFNGIDYIYDADEWITCILDNGSDEGVQYISSISRTYTT